MTVTAGFVLMMGAAPADADPDQFSTGTFTGSPEATFNVTSTELRSNAFLNHVTRVDHITVPEGETATVANSTLLDADLGPDDPAGPATVTGSGNLVATAGTVLGARVGGSLTVSVPADEVVSLGGTFRDQAHLQVHGEVVQGADLYLDDDAVLDVYGTHRMEEGVSADVDFTGDDPGVEVIHPGGRLSGQGGALFVQAPFVNKGTVDSGTGLIHIGPRVASPSASSGTFRADPAGTLDLGSSGEGHPPLVLNQPDFEGDVLVLGKVLASGLDLRGGITTQSTAQLTLSDTTTLNNDASLTGDVTVNGQLQADLGETGTATLSGVEVTGSVHALSGTLNVTNLAPTTLSADGTLIQGRWTAWDHATLDLPEVTTTDAWLELVGPAASFGDGLANLRGTGPNGWLILAGPDLAVPGPFRNHGMLALHSGSRFVVGAKFRQFATGGLVLGIDAGGHGRLRALGPRDLAGTLYVDRDEAYEPPLDTVLSFITSEGRVEVDDRFDSVVSESYGSRRIRVDYGVNRVRYWVDSLG